MSIDNYHLLDDMQKYNKNFNREFYENKSVEDIKHIFKDYYEAILPIDLLTWSRVNEPDDKMTYKDSYWRQITFIRDKINYLLNDGETYEYISENPVLVINTHRSKSIILPVCKINLTRYGIIIILRNNFYDWKISVVSEQDLNVDFKEIFNEKEAIHYVYCEGFQENQVFGLFTESKKEFTVSIGGNENLYVFMYLLKNYLKNLK